MVIVYMAPYQGWKIGFKNLGFYVLKNLKILKVQMLGFQGFSITDHI